RGCGGGTMDYSYPLRVSASRYPERTAVSFRGASVSYAAVDERADVLAGALVERGLTGRTVGTLLLNEPDTLVTYLGLARAGGVNVPVNVRLSSREQEYVLTDAGASCLVVDREYLAQVRELRERLPEVRDVVVCGAGQDELEDEVAFGTLLRGDRPDERDLPRCEDGSPATITYTAGTTGFPKGVVRTHGANLWNVANSALGSPRSTDDV
ncbi:MAG: AMP-binding protein, partial [Actinophytocola sp.]|nr:AMP-binding protein [Actinophytocola sp.]